MQRPADKVVKTHADLGFCINLDVNLKNNSETFEQLKQETIFCRMLL